MIKFLQLKPIQWIFAGTLALLFYALSTGKFTTNQQLKTPCSEPVTYQIGEIDNRFYITENELIDLMRDVAGVWSEAADTTIIEYAEEGDITINLIYAEEQDLSDREKQYRDRLENEEFSITVLENEYTRMNQQYEKEFRQYEQDSKNLQQSVEQLNRWVVQKNEDGGFNQEDLEQFEERKKEIERIKQELARKEETLKQKADEVNSRITFLNKKIENKNNMVDDYNRMFTGVRKFTEGDYEWTSESRNINVYHFIDREELKLVIAHEMGHAFGIEHVSNPKSVMYRLMGNQARPGIELTEEDIRALQNICEHPLN